MCLFFSTNYSATAPLFKEGEDFRRTKANSPIFLRFSDHIHVKNYGRVSLTRSGFKIFTHSEDPTKYKEVGYITFEFKPHEHAIEFPWVFIAEKKEEKDMPYRLY